jgi:hypothetical protein
LSPNTWGDEVLVYFGYPQAHEDDAEPAAGEASVFAEYLSFNSYGSRVAN